MGYRLSILFLVLFLSVMAACKKQDNYAVPNPPDHLPALDVINATADTLDYFINGTRQNNASDIYPGGATNYLAALFGTGNYSFKKAGSPITLFQKSLTLDTATSYSLFVCGESADKVFILTDDFSSAAGIDTMANTAAVRFVNASPNASPLNIIVNTGTTINLQNLAFKGVSNFYPVKDTINEVKILSGGTLLKDTTITPIGGQVFTLFTKGTPGGKGNAAFGAVLIANAVLQ